MGLVVVVIEGKTKKAVAPYTLLLSGTLAVIGTMGSSIDGPFIQCGYIRVWEEDWGNMAIRFET